jgi:ligand-binding sensor domain-containing protein/signal transduction histidine kinase
MLGLRQISYAILLGQVAAGAAADTRSVAGVAASYPLQVTEVSQTIRLPVIDGNDIPFLRLSRSQGLSQNRVTQIIQDNRGFMWFGTQYGLNRYDGYQFKVFKHDPSKPDSFCGVYVSVLYKDRSGTLWAGCENRLDRFEPMTETFVHYRLEAEKASPHISAAARHVFEDGAGMLWLSTGQGLYRLDPHSGKTTRFHHVSNDASSLSSDEVWSSGEDRRGTFWVATGEGLDAFDRNRAEVTVHVPLHEPHEVSFYEDRSGVFWVLCASGSGLSVLDRAGRRLTPYSFAREDFPGLPLTGAIQMLEDREGNLWIATLSDGILRLDRQHSVFIRYRNDPLNADTIPENRITTLFEDREEDVWVGLGATAPVFFATRPLPFKKLPFDAANRANLGETLVNAIYQDREGILWVGTTGALERCDPSGRQCTHYALPGQGIASDVLSIVEDPAGKLWVGTSGQGLCEFDRDHGRCEMLRHRGEDLSSLSDDTVMRLFIDHEGALWVGTANGLNRFNAVTRRFTVYHDPSPDAAAKYASIVEDGRGDLWIGSMGSGVLRFNRATQQLNVVRGPGGEPLALGNLRVNAVFIDHAGVLWAGTENGLNKIDPGTGKIIRYTESDGLASSAIACILEGPNGKLWMSTTKGISSLDPPKGAFQNYAVADGLPGPGADLTAYSTCLLSSSGVMYFGGFVGAVGFHPEDVRNDSYAPPVALTAFVVSGTPVAVGSGSPLSRVIGLTEQVTLTHDQNNLSLEFSALSFPSPETNRYRYKLDGLDTNWHEVGSYQRLATYTTLPSGNYKFVVEGATSRGPWSAPTELSLHILPAWWATWWFRAFAVGLIGCAVLLAYHYRIRQIHRQFNLRLEERVRERVRIARELHDSLLQGFEGLLYRLEAVRGMLPKRADEAAQAVSVALDKGDEAIAESRAAVRGLRASVPVGRNIEQALTALRDECGSEGAREVPAYRVIVEGERREIAPLVQDEVYRIAREAFRNSIRHAKGEKIEAEITYREDAFLLRLRDDGVGMAADSPHREGHWGLQGMHERATQLGGRLDVWSERGAGTEIALSVPAHIAYSDGSRKRSR